MTSQLPIADNASVLEEAEYLVNGPKRAEYGSPRYGMELIAALWEPIIGGPVSPEQVVLCLAAMKLARATERLHNGQEIKRDTITDLAGYAGVLELVLRDAPEEGAEVADNVTLLKAGQ